ncbi:creatininase family protein [Haloechinothrix salitolerans]|uniref:Creatininase family protein n=1 Tax=Haloechinothrix salitolerans TaxID=926830 RepID=A0ABW2BUX6_9PSEU
MIEPHRYLVPLDTTEEVDEGAADVALLPVGSYEQHGRYLPLATDTLVACAIANEIAAAYPVRRLPPLTVSCSHEHEGWAGTVSISSRTLAAVVDDIARSLHDVALVLVNGHGGNYVLANVVQEASVGAQRMALFPGAPDLQAAHTAAGIDTPLDSDMHAGEIETSILLASYPDVVRNGYPAADHLADDRRHMLTLGLKHYTRSGVVGRPSLASAAKGRDLLTSLTASFADYHAVLTRQHE